MPVAGEFEEGAIGGKDEAMLLGGMIGNVTYRGGKYKSGEGNLKVISMLSFGDYLLDVTPLPRRIKSRLPAVPGAGAT